MRSLVKGKEVVRIPDLKSSLRIKNDQTDKEKKGL